MKTEGKGQCKKCTGRWKNGHSFSVLQPAVTTGVEKSLVLMKSVETRAL